MVRTSGLDEEEAYREIEEKFGFSPVDLDYLPNGVGFLHADFGEEIQCINMLYGQNDDVKMIYTIRPNYRAGSLGKDVEDDFVEEYIRENQYTTIYIRKYVVENEQERWFIQFEYKETFYSLTIVDEYQKEIEKIVENLYFS